MVRPDILPDLCLCYPISLTRYVEEKMKPTNKEKIERMITQLQSMLETDDTLSELQTLQIQILILDFEVIMAMEGIE